MDADGLEHLAPMLASVAAGQRGAFTAAQAREAGYTPEEIYRLRRGRRRPEQWVSLRRGIYTVASWFEALSPADQHRVRASALSLALVNPAVLSHETAAVEHGLDLLDPDLSRLHVTRGDLRGSRLEAGVHHHAAELPGVDVVRRPDLPDITSLARTAVDVAREAPRLEAKVAACDSALRLGLGAQDLVEMMARCRSWPGARGASRAVAMADGRAANPGESWSRAVLTAYGQAPSDLQVPFHDAQGLIGYADFFWEDGYTVGELDGKVKYVVAADASPEEAGRMLRAEKTREDRLRGIGLQVVRWGVVDLYRPRLLIGSVIAARARGGRRSALVV